MTEKEWSSERLIEAWLALAERNASDEELEWLNQQIVEDKLARKCLIAFAQHQAFLTWMQSPVYINGQSFDAPGMTKRLAAQRSTE